MIAMSKPSRCHGASGFYPSNEWETETERSPRSNAPQRGGRIRPCRREATIRGPAVRQESESESVAVASPQDKKVADRKMGGLPLPDVVREILKDRSILWWNEEEGLYEVNDGDRFEAR